MCCSQCITGFLGKREGRKNTGGNAPLKQDPVDKLVSRLAGNKLKPDQVEKLTDGARGMYEKRTGKKVPGFISN